MEIKEYQEKAQRTLVRLETHIMDDLHMVLGLHTEASEIADVYKKQIAYGKPLDLVNIKEELGDALWYVANMCNLHGWDLRDILETNIKKLKARFPEKFTTEKALNRDLTTERKILEEKPQQLTQQNCPHPSHRIRENISGGRFDECLDCGKTWG